MLPNAAKMVRLRVGTNTSPRLPDLESDNPQYFDKEILRVGSWAKDEWPAPWNVTRGELLAIANNFRLSRHNGIKIPFIWTHNGEDPRNNIGEVVNVRVDGNKLVARVSATKPEDKRSLGITANEVSVEVTENHKDGKNRTYPGPMLTHLAVVNHPVVPDQEPFRRLTLKPTAKQPEQGKVRRMADTNADPGAAAADENPSVPNEFDATTATEWINAILSASGSPFSLPEDTSPDNFMDRLYMLAEQAKAMNPQTKEPTTPTPAVADATNAGSPDVLMASLKKANAETVRQLQNKINQLERDGAKRAFEHKADGLIRDGKLTPAKKTALLSLGAKFKYDLSLLDVTASESSQVPQGGGKSRQLSSGEPPAVNGSAAAMTKERAKEIAATF